MIADATYNGRPLEGRSWRAHLDILSGLLTGAQPAIVDFDHDQDRAWIAISQAGLVRDVSRPPSDGSFVWARWELTPRGREYIAALLVSR